MKAWYIPDYAVLYLLYVNGIPYEKRSYAWYYVDLPMDLNGHYELPDGFVIEAVRGIELRAARKEQGEQ